MGNIPSNKKMPSTVILSPQPGEDIAADKTFTVSLQVANLQAGSFSDADAQYYSQPQDLNGQGEIIGHTHVTIQDMQGSLTPAAPLDASKFSFFKGINDAGDGNGGLKAVVTGGLAAGFYRVCTMSSATTHQPVIMPVAQRGTQDDCTKFTVGQGNAKGQQANGQQANGQQNKGQQAANGKNQGGKKKAAREFQA
jgi:transcription initiation factor TFIID subunit 15